MVKYNPATKAVEGAKNPNGGEEEESSESDVVSQMLENYEEYETHRSRPSTDVLERLPDHAEMQKGELWIPNPKTAYDYNRNKMSLTELRRRVLLTKLENPDATNLKVADIVGCSPSLVSRTTKVFGFLLDDPYLIDGFVYKGQVPSDYFVVRNGDKEFAFPVKEQAVEAGEELWGADCQIVAPEDDDETESQDESEDEPSLSPEELEEANRTSSEDTDGSVSDTDNDPEKFVIRKDGEEFSFHKKEMAVEAGIARFDGAFTIEYPDGTVTQYASSREIDEESEDDVVSLSVSVEEFQSLVQEVDDGLQLKLLWQLYEQ